MAWNELKISIDPIKKAKSIHGLDQQIDAFVYQKPLSLDLYQVILNQAKYLNHMTYAIYGLIMVIMGMIGYYATLSDALIMMAIIVSLLPLSSLIECHDAKRHGLLLLHQSYPFDHRMVLTIRFLYLTLINSIVVIVSIGLFNMISDHSGFGLVLLLIYVFMGLILSVISLAIAFWISKMQWALLINGCINGIVTFVMLAIMIDYQAFDSIMISVCIVELVLTIILWSIVMHRLRQRKSVWIN